MEASVSGTPAAAESAQTQLEAPAAQPALAPQPPTAQPEPGSAEGDVHAQLKAMEERVTAAEAQLKGQQTAQPTDLLGALMAEPGQTDLSELGLSPEDLAALGVEGQQQPDGDGQEQLSELDDYVNERIQQALDPLVRERREEQVRALQEKYPDIVEPKILGRVEATLGDLVQRYGDESLKFDPALVEMTYKAAKAEMADAGAVPAEQAANHGASIETQAGQTQAGESSVEDQYKREVFGDAVAGGEVFR